MAPFKRTALYLLVLLLESPIETLEDRPEGHRHEQRLLLLREIAAMIDRVTGNKLLPASIRQDIIERADGIPLFAEEITKAVLEAESEGAAERAVAAIPSPSIAVPASLHASLMSRLDRRSGQRRKSRRSELPLGGSSPLP